MNRMFTLVALVLAVAAVTFAGHFPAAFHRGAYAFHGYYPGKYVNKVLVMIIKSTYCLKSRLC